MTSLKLQLCQKSTPVPHADTSPVTSHVGMLRTVTWGLGRHSLRIECGVRLKEKSMPAKQYLRVLPPAPAATICFLSLRFAP